MGVYFLGSLTKFIYRARHPGSNGGRKVKNKIWLLLMIIFFSNHMRIIFILISSTFLIHPIYGQEIDKNRRNITLLIFTKKDVEQAAKGLKKPERSGYKNINLQAERTVENSEFVKYTRAQTLEIYSKRLGMDNLKNRKLKIREAELRIWVGFGSLEPRCFILNISGDKWSARTIYPVEEKIEKSGFLKQDLDSPKSGWIAFKNYLDKLKIFSRKIPSDTKTLVDPNEETIIIEIKNKSGYYASSFPIRTKTQNGKKIKDFVKNIEQKFSIALLYEVRES